LLGDCAAGTVTVALAVPFAAGPPAAWPSASGPLSGVRVAAPRPGDPPGQTRLRGTVAGVADALPAGVLLVAADGVPPGLYAVDAGAPGLTMTPVVSLDATRQLADLTLDDVPARCVASGPSAVRAVQAALAAGAAMLAAEQLGVAQRCLDMTVAYVKERHQFARPVGSFQALKHRLADVWVAVTQAPVAVALAKASCSEAAVHAAQECVQLHGGIGFTWEHPAHLYLKRAKSSSIGFGTPDWHRAVLAGLAGLAAPGAPTASGPAAGAAAARAAGAEVTGAGATGAPATGATGAAAPEVAAAGDTR
jgi:alkylation response protein AidB-like acyl-CoA dehydrogenase